MRRSAPIPVGLIGAGKHGARYLRHIAEDVPELRVALLSRRDRAAGLRQAEAVGARFVADFRELAGSPEIAAVIAVTPPSLNLEICRIAARAGKAILIEKPLATSVVAAARIRDAVDRAGVPSMVAHTLRFNTVVRAIHRHLGEVGTISQICLSQRFEPSPLRWLDDPAESGGGIILHTGVHSFDLLRHFSGAEPSRAFATTGRVATSRTEDNFVAVFGFGDDALAASVSGSRSTAGRSGAIEISGDRGQLFGDHVHGIAYRIEGTRRYDLEVVADAPTVRETLRAFARILSDSAPAPITIEDGFRAVAMADACYRSAASRKPVRIRRR